MILRRRLLKNPIGNWNWWKTILNQNGKCRKAESISSV